MHVICYDLELILVGVLDDWVLGNVKLGCNIELLVRGMRR